MRPIAVHLNATDLWIRDVIFHTLRYLTSVHCRILKPIITVVRLLGSVFGLTVLGTIGSRLVLDVSHLLALILSIKIEPCARYGKYVRVSYPVELFIPGRLASS